jgi:putative endonuclease
MKYYFVYILKCNDDSFYTGVTNDIDRRLHEHHSGENISCYTYHKKPLTLVFCEEYLEIN